MNLRLRCLLLLFIGNVSALAAELPGTWSNGESEFKTISLMLRSDGQAIFATAVIPTYARWKKNDTGFDLTIAGDGKSVTLPFTFDPATATLSSALHDTQVILRKVSDQEPPDLLARAKAKQEEDTARWKKQFRMEDRTLADVAALRRLITTWLAIPASEPHAETIFIRPSGKLPTFTLRRFGPEKLFIEIPMESRSTATPSGYPLEGKYAPAGTVSNLPLRFELPAAMQTRIQSLSKPGVAIDTHASVQVSAFETEAYYRYTQLVLTAADPGTPAVIDEIMSILWPTQPTNITVSLHTRMPRESE